jgi:hypothetical protein
MGESVSGRVGEGGKRVSGDKESKWNRRNKRKERNEKVEKAGGLPAVGAWALVICNGVVGEGGRWSGGGRGEVETFDNP